MINRLFDLAMTHVHLLLGIVGIFLGMIFIIYLIGGHAPTYSKWHKLANLLDIIANFSLTVLGVIGFCELLFVLYHVSQLLHGAY